MAVVLSSLWGITAHACSVQRSAEDQLRTPLSPQPVCLRHSAGHLGHPSFGALFLQVRVTAWLYLGSSSLPWSLENSSRSSLGHCRAFLVVSFPFSRTTVPHCLKNCVSCSVRFFRRLNGRPSSRRKLLLSFVSDKKKLHRPIVSLLKKAEWITFKWMCVLIKWIIRNNRSKRLKRREQIYQWVLFSDNGQNIPVNK